jgi:peptidoglycan/LPS O-acetylase OafA/YrhL
MQTKNRIPGLDVLRSAAIMLVFMYHYMCFVSHQATFGFLSDIGWVGVDLFFVLSGYLIGNQIFSALAKQRKFSLLTFYSRRLLRTLPNYLFILGIYFLIPSFRENTVLPPLWKFLTFTQNFGLQGGAAFSHAWSLCIEEQFYLILPAVALIIYFKKSIGTSWRVISAILIAGILVRSILWIYCAHHANGDFGGIYQTVIYYSSFCRLDELVLGVSIAMLRNFHEEIWEKIIARGNLILLLGILGSSITFYLFLHYYYGFFMTAFGYPLLAVSFAALTLAALSPSSYLYKARIPGAASLAVWSYAIYLIHKPLSVITYAALIKWGMNPSSFYTVAIIMFVILLFGWLLYMCIETPFLKLRDKISTVSSARAPTINTELIAE